MGRRFSEKSVAVLAAIGNAKRPLTVAQVSRATGFSAAELKVSMKNLTFRGLLVSGRPAGSTDARARVFGLPTNRPPAPADVIRAAPGRYADANGADLETLYGALRADMPRSVVDARFVRRFVEE